MERAPIIGVSSTATPSSTGCSFVRSSQKCLPPLSTTRGERTEARKKRVPHTLFSSSLSLFLDSEQCASTSMSRLLSRLLHPSPSFKPSLTRVSSRGSSTRLFPYFRLGCLATRGEEVFCFANQLILTKSPSSTFVGKKGKLTAGLTRIYRNTIYRLTRIRRYGNRIRGKPLRRNELIRRLAERTSSATFIESCVRICHPIFLQAGSFPFDSRIDVL